MVLGGLLLVPGVLWCREGPVGADAKEKAMQTIVIPKSTVYDAGDYKVAVSYIVRGRYRDASGQEVEGLKASLVIVRKGTGPGESETTVEVGAGSAIRLGDRTYRILDVMQDESGDGAVRLQGP